MPESHLRLCRAAIICGQGRLRVTHQHWQNACTGESGRQRSSDATTDDKAEEGNSHGQNGYAPTAGVQKQDGERNTAAISKTQSL